MNSDIAPLSSPPVDVDDVSHPIRPILEDQLDCFWEPGPEFERIEIRIAPPETPLELLRRLGQSPFERSEFPLVGFLATTYEKVSRYALERRSVS